MMFQNELLLGAVILAWIGYELYGRTAVEWLSGSSTYVRIAGGLVIIGYLYWQLNSNPAEFNETLDLAKQLLTHQGTATSLSANKEKRNVSGLLKKKIAASQEWKCGTCKALLDETYEVDHRKALFQGGTNEPENLVALCPNCHRHKTVEERLSSTK
jgi:predicted HNH restriction endonuclease